MEADPLGPPGPPTLKPSSPETKSEPPCPISVLAAGGFRVLRSGRVPGRLKPMRSRRVAQSGLGARWHT
jgi:hypothetical protein